MHAPIKGALVAAAVAALFATTGSVTTVHADSHEEGEVKCKGINECKGKGECGGAGHDCAGKNECKGKGWLEVSSEEECKEKGGEVVS